MLQKTIQNHKSNVVAAIKKRTLLVLVVVVLVLFLGIVFLVNRVRSASVKARSIAPITSGVLTLQTIQWKVEKNEKAMIPPPANEQYVTVSYALSQNTGKPMWFAPSVESYVRDSAGKNHGIELVVLDNPFDSKEYQAEYIAAGQSAYLVPKEDMKLEWCYKLPEVLMSKALCVPLNSYNKL